MPNLEDVRAITSTISDGNKKNFHSDGFSFDLQTALNQANIPFTGQLMAFRRSGMDSAEGIKMENALSSNNDSFVSKDMKTYIPKGMRAFPKIILHEAGHHLDNIVIGNQTHFWTEIILGNNQVYCFDNNDPEGITKEEFFASLEFSMETYIPECEPHPGKESLLSQPEISARTIFRDNDHRYKTHEEILSSNHLLLVTTSVDNYRENLKNEVNWQYRSAALANTHYTFLDSKYIRNIITPPDAHTQKTEKCIQKFQSMKNSLNRLKTPTPAKTNKIVEPQFFQEHSDSEAHA
jgi:hypothetical protein